MLSLIDRKGEVRLKAYFEPVKLRLTNLIFSDAFAIMLKSEFMILLFIKLNSSELIFTFEFVFYVRSKERDVIFELISRSKLSESFP